MTKKKNNDLEHISKTTNRLAGELKSKHTPGPWIAWDTGNGMAICVSPNDNDLIPNVAAFRNEICRVRPKIDDPAFHELWEIGKSNAHLIAAAPEMLEFLKMLEKEADSSASNELAAQLRALIAKAEGKE